MLSRLIIAVVAGIVATLICILVGDLLAAVNVSIAVVVGGFLKGYAGLIGVLVALYIFFTGRTL